MDINIVNAILQLCSTQQTCLFEVPSLSEYCLEQRLCTNSRYVLASIRNYMEIFKISRDRTRIEFFMPFEICRNCFSDGVCQNNGQVCSNLHVCYEYFSTNTCRRSMNCPYAHQLSARYHENILGTLMNLDLDALTKAFRVFCQSKKHILGQSSSRGGQQQPTSSSSSLVNNPNASSSSANNWRLTATPQISGNTTWKTNNRILFTSRILSTQPQTINPILDRGLQIYWTPQKSIQTHFVEVIFSNQDKSNGGPIRSHTVYQHLGIAQLFYQNSEIVDRVIHHGPVTFQSFTFIPRLLQRTTDLRHICFSNMPMENIHIPLYIDAVSMPYKKIRFEYYQNDKQTVLVEYNEDIDFMKISSNLRNHPKYNGFAIKCIQLYHPETLFIEYNQDYSEQDIKQLFQNQRIFHIKMYSSCAFVHFHSHDDLMRSIQRAFDEPIKVTPIYIDIYSQRHLDNYLQQRQNEVQPESSPIENPTNGEILEEPIPEPSLPVLSPVTADEDSQIPFVPESPVEEKTPSIVSANTDCKLDTEPSVEPRNENENHEVEQEDDDENEIPVSDDDFHDLQSEFDNDDLFVDESVDSNGDMEFLRSAAKNLMSSLAEMEAASANMNGMDAPHSLLYGDDYVVTIKSRRFALAFLDYTQFRVEKQRNPDKFRLLAALKKNTQTNSSNNPKKRTDDTPSPVPMIEPDLFGSIETKVNKKKRTKRNKKKKITNHEKSEPTPESVHEDEQEEDDNTIHVLNDQEFGKNHFVAQRLPHVYLDNDLKPCIVVAGEEHNEENEHDTGDHEDWHNIVAGGKPVLVPKKTKKKKQQTPQKEEKPKVEPSEQNPPTPTGTTVPSQPPTEPNSLVIPANCRGFVHQPKSCETFRLRLRRSFSSINVRFQPETHMITIEGNIKPNVQQCLTYLNSLASFKRSFFITHDPKFPQTTINNIIRMQQSTAQVKLDPHANYDRIFRATARLLDYQLKQQYYQQQCIYCRQSKKQFRVTYLEFPSDKQNNEEFHEAIQQRVAQLLTTRFTYIAIALSADLMMTKRWTEFYKNLSQYKDMNKTILIRKINTIIQVYGLHANVQQIQTSITKFLDANRYETDVIETEQASGIFSIFKKDFQDMENLDVFREGELRFVYRHHRHVLLVQCFQEKFGMVKARIQKLRSQLSTIIQPVKSSILSRYYSKSDEIQRIAAASNCIITIEQRADHTIDLKILGRSPERAQKLIKEFEEQKYSTRKIQNQDIHLFTEQDLKDLENECSTCNVSYIIDQNNNLIELEGLAGDFVQIEKAISDLCLIAARRVVDDIQYSAQWVYYEPKSNKPMAFGETIKRQLEKSYANQQKGLVNFKDHTNQIRTFDLDKMVEIQHGNNNSNTSPTFVKIERRDLKNPQSVQLPTHWSAMTTPWERIFLGRRDNIAEWKANNEIQRVLRLPHMLPELWIIEIYRIQNPRMFQQYIAHRENFAARSQDFERTLYRLAQLDKIDDMCAHGFNRSHTDTAFSAYGLGCHFYCKAIDIDRTATLLAQNLQPTGIMLQQQTPSKPPIRFLFVCKVLVGRYTRGDSSTKTCPPGYDSLVNDIQSPEVFVTHQDAQVLPEYLIAYQSALF